MKTILTQNLRRCLIAHLLFLIFPILSVAQVSAQRNFPDESSALAACQFDVAQFNRWNGPAGYSYYCQFDPRFNWYWLMEYYSSTGQAYYTFTYAFPFTTTTSTTTTTTTLKPTCSMLISKGLKGPVVRSQTDIVAQFVPQYSYTLADAAQVCGFKTFDWQQLVLVYPPPSLLKQFGTSVPLTAPPPFYDPPPGGYTNQRFTSYPFYYDPRGYNGKPSELETQYQKTPYLLSFFDSPAHGCLYGGVNVNNLCGGKSAPKGAQIVFRTDLVGVTADYKPVPLGINFMWSSDYNGNTGGVSLRNDVSASPGGAGGVTIISVQDTSNYQPGVPTTSTGPAPLTLASGTACNGVFTGEFNGSISVSPGQSCTFINGKINGDIQVYGGKILLSQSAVTGNVQIYGSASFMIGPYASVNGTLQIWNLAGGDSVNKICDSMIYGDMNIFSNDAKIQIGASDLATCGGNVVGKNSEVHNNRMSISLVKNIVNGNLHVHNNTGVTQITSNEIVRALQCEANVAITGGANNSARKLGQCQNF